MQDRFREEMPQNTPDWSSRRCFLPDFGHGQFVQRDVIFEIVGFIRVAHVDVDHFLLVSCRISNPDKDRVPPIDIVFVAQDAVQTAGKKSRLELIEIPLLARRRIGVESHLFGNGVESYLERDFTQVHFLAAVPPSRSERKAAPSPIAFLIQKRAASALDDDLIRVTPHRFQLVELPEADEFAVENHRAGVHPVRQGLCDEQNRLNEGALSAAVCSRKNRQRCQGQIAPVTNGFEIGDAPTGDHASPPMRMVVWSYHISSFGSSSKKLDGNASAAARSRFTSGHGV